MAKSVDPDDSPQEQSGPEIIKLFSCSTQPSMKIFMLITFKSMKNSILGLSEPEKARFLDYFYL